MIGSMLALDDRKIAFSEKLEELFAQTPREDGLESWRQKAWNHFLERGLPKQKESFQYFPLRKLYGQNLSFSQTTLLRKEDVHPLILPECQSSCLIFVDGVFEKELSELENFPKKSVILPLTEALDSYGIFLHGQLTKSLKEEVDPFVLLNTAFQKQGAFVYFPPKIEMEAPLQILHITTKKEVFSSPKTHLFLGKEAKAHVVVTTRGVKGESFCNASFDLSLEEGANLKFYEWHDLREKGWINRIVRAGLKKGSHLEGVSCALGEGIFRQDNKIDLLEENAEATIKGIWKLKGEGQAHTKIHIEHIAPNCRSMQLFKGALHDHSRSSFEGKIYVHPEAQKTEAYQLNNNLLLSEEAIAYTKPNLEIFADDVKASHGATVAQLDEESLFYLKTRGISEKQGKQLLLDAFIGELVKEIPHPTIKTSFGLL